MEWLTQSALDMLKAKYLDFPTLEQQYDRICRTAAKHKPGMYDKFYEMMVKGWYSNSSPCLANMGAPDKGLPVACSGSVMADELSNIYQTRHEIAMLTKAGFGTAVYLGHVRPRGAMIGGRFPASGVLPIITGLRDDMNYIQQSGHRRGSVACYLPVEHGDFWEVVEYVTNNSKDINLGWVISADFIAKLDANDDEATKKYQAMMKLKFISGKGYFYFKDKVKLPEVYGPDAVCHSSQLCSEILLPNDADTTYTCVLGSLNVAKYDEWKDTDVVETAIHFLDAVVSEFLELAKGKPGMERVIKGTEYCRAVGLGQMGLHTAMQDRGLVWGSLQALWFDQEVAQTIHDRAMSVKTKNWSRIAIAPTKSSSNIMGGVSQGIEQYFSACFTEVLSSGEVLRENPAFVRLAKSKGRYSKALMQDLAENYLGSVQHLDWLTDHEKAVFRANFETNQLDVLKHAAMRQRYVDQMQSINLVFGPSATLEEISRVHKAAFKDPNIWSLYYMRALNVDPSGTLREVDLDDCESCQ